VPDNPPRPPPLPAAFRPASTLAASGSASHGTNATVKSQRFVTPVKLEFNVPATQHAFNLNKAHIEVLKLIKANKDPSLEIVPFKADQAKFTDLLQFPANEEDYSAMFHHAVDKQPTEARKIIVKHSLITKQKFSDLKFQNAKLMDSMFANKIWIRYNQSDTLQVVALGFMQGVHPRVAHREGFSSKLQDAIHLEMTETEHLTIKEALSQGKPQGIEEGEVEQPDIKLEAITHTIGFGNGDGRIKTEAFEIRVPLEICLMIKEILTQLGTKNAIPDGRFIPYGLVQTIARKSTNRCCTCKTTFSLILGWSLSLESHPKHSNTHLTLLTRTPMSIKQQSKVTSSPKTASDELKPQTAPATLANFSS
jgi:hypothetical protein